MFTNDQLVFFITTAFHTIFAIIAVVVVLLMAIYESLAVKNESNKKEKIAKSIIKIFVYSFIIEILLGIIMAFEIVLIGPNSIFNAIANGPTVQQLVFAILLPKVANGIIIFVLLAKKKVRIDFMKEINQTKKQFSNI